MYCLKERRNLTPICTIVSSMILYMSKCWCIYLVSGTVLMFEAVSCKSVQWGLMSDVLRIRYVHTLTRHDGEKWYRLSFVTPVHSDSLRFMIGLASSHE